MKIIIKHLASYRYAIRGIGLVFRLEANMIFHVIAGMAVVIVNILLSVTKTEWLITLTLVGLAWMAEMFNTAIEKLCDRVTKEKDYLIGDVKDISAGAVLLICGFAVIAAAIIYLPYIL